MLMKNNNILTCLAVLASVCAGAQGGSIWAKANSAAQAMYSDDTARKIGDSLSIVINERGVINNETKRGLDKSSARAAKITGKQDIITNAADQATGRLFSLNNPLDITVNATSDFAGDAKFNSDRSLTDLVTVTVTDVLPNGNLVVVGSRRREIEGDSQIVQVSGIVRPSDISFANAVTSDKVADFRVVYKHTGLENHTTKPNWLDRFLNVVSPF